MKKTNLKIKFFQLMTPIVQIFSLKNFYFIIFNIFLLNSL